MKSNYKFYLVLLAIPVYAFLFLSYSSGQTYPYSGSPGDGGSTCAVCHTGSANYNAEALITTNIPDAGYELNHEYTITLSVSSDVVKNGFQITAENASNDKVGEFVAGEGSQVTDSSHDAVTHTYIGTEQTVWTMTWISPATDQGVISFYAAVNATNSNNSDSGDQVVTTSISVEVLDVETEEVSNFNVYPNPTTALLFVDLPEGFAKANYTVRSILGRVVLAGDFTQTVNVSSLDSGVYTIELVSDNRRASSKFVVK